LANRSNYYPRTLRLQSWEVQRTLEVMEMAFKKIGEKNAK